MLRIKKVQFGIDLKGIQCYPQIKSVRKKCDNLSIYLMGFKDVLACCAISYLYGDLVMSYRNWMPLGGKCIDIKMTD